MNPERAVRSRRRAADLLFSDFDIRTSFGLGYFVIRHFFRDPFGIGLRTAPSLPTLFHVGRAGGATLSRPRNVAGRRCRDTLFLKPET